MKLFFFGLSLYRKHKEQLNDLYSSPNTIRMIKLGRMRWTGHVVRMGERRGVCVVLWRNLREIVDMWRTQTLMGGFGGKSIHMAAYFPYSSCSESRCREIQLDNAQKFVQSSSSSISTLIRWNKIINLISMQTCTININFKVKNLT